MKKKKNKGFNSILYNCLVKPKLLKQKDNLIFMCGRYSPSE